MKEKKLVARINSFIPKMQALSDSELKHLTVEFKERLSKTAMTQHDLDAILPEAFAAISEAAYRVLGMRAFDVQLLGGIILHKGEIAEMKTGEGKTLVAIFPAYLNALTGRGVHVITVNDYLAKRDAAEMSQVFEFMGLTTGCVQHDMQGADRQKQYQCDITYITNNEVGFDYLRDNMVTRTSDKVQRGLNFAIIDEADSILIDEARTPLIISGASGKPTKLYEMCDILARQFVQGPDIQDVSKIDMIVGEVIDEEGDFAVNKKDKTVVLTESGVEKAEQFFHLDNYADPKNFEIQHCLLQALKAESLMLRDRDYIVRNNGVLIVDEFTGRVMEGRRFSDGLHQALEAKEHVEIQQESCTLATITFQNFFNKYHKKSGMTGTAYTEKREFREVYGMDVVRIPTNRPVLRKDLNDLVYMTKEEKYVAVYHRIVEAHEKGQPVLVGTASIEDSEILSRVLNSYHLPHTVLNAKNNEKEAEIVSHAGEAGRITISTNMAGRGTDIKLDKTSKANGGLLVIGTQRHESRRIDDQLRGRSGRQGDPGESQFYISLDDDLMKIYAPEKMKKLFRSLGVEEFEPVEHKMLTKSIQKAQKAVEGNNYGIRKSLLEYDVVNNEQREIIYAERENIIKIFEDPTQGVFRDMIPGIVNHLVDTTSKENLSSVICNIFPIEEFSETKMSKKELKKFITEKALEQYDDKAKLFKDDQDRYRMESLILLKTLDNHWTRHIDRLDGLRSWIGASAYGQKDPRTEYRIVSYEMFDEMLEEIKEGALQIFFTVRRVEQTMGGAA